jgi:hypothetical protein
MTTDGPIVDEVRARAMEISARFDHDAHKYAEHLRQRQRDPRFQGLIVSQITVAPAADSPAKGAFAGKN